MTRLPLLALVTFCVLSKAAFSHDLPRRAIPTGKAEYIAMVATAAPPAIVEKATILMPDGKGGTIVVQKGTNGFTCDVMPRGIPKCADEGGMEWLSAIRSGTGPSEKAGLIFMLAGAPNSSHDHHGMAESHEHFSWLDSGPHIMVVGRAAREVGTFDFRAVNADPSRAHLMYPGTKYEHLMLPMPAGVLTVKGGQP